MSTIRERVAEMGADIIESDRFEKAKTVPHHNKYRSIAGHSVETAENALRISEWLKRRGVDVDEREAVRTSLLHDIGMTEDEVFLSPSRVKAYTHPEEGARIAREEFAANDVQVEAIRRHMWPIGRTTPRHATGWIVVAADKCTSIVETGREAARRSAVAWRKYRNRQQGER